jgi:hypothetical protein
MAETPDRMKRRHIREKRVIDHLAENVFDAKARPGASTQSPATDGGQTVEDQVRKEWNPHKGGLPIFNK